MAENHCGGQWKYLRLLNKVVSEKISEETSDCSRQAALNRSSHNESANI